ncbi:TonB-dependent receptor [Aestuariibacter halophilus]|uniref:TonB-dependent receptor n=1 Tax=Fluctibacter halophilus TaxID=226011 RepID=A0ABS8G7N5_9ALTE|nr:TonB-dependent receptor [Aestuariibacter halophilus]MCC2616550.1 TonB-dependent receptor [Aestuariibacter halophilus]
MLAKDAAAHPGHPTTLSRLTLSMALAMGSLYWSATAVAQTDETVPAHNALEVIEVTAQKRTQNVMKVPVTVSTVSADVIEKNNAVLLSDVDKYIPGFSFDDSSMTQAGVQIRGISSPGITVGGDPSSASFYDDVYMPRAAQNVLFSDIQRVEVLKGPQGTLFGRNAAMGVVSVIPNEPGAYDEGFVRLTAGTDYLMRAEGMFNKALSDQVFVRVNALTTEQDGFINNLSSPDWNDSEPYDLGARDHKAARIALRWEPSDATQLQLALEVDDLEQAPPMAVGLSEWAYQGGTDPFASAAQNDVRNGVESRDMTAWTAKLWHTFDQRWSMKGVVSHRQWETVNREDEDGTADITRYFDTSNNEDSDIFYTEWQLNYSGERVNVVTGVSYSKEDVSQQTELNLTADTLARLTTAELNGQLTQGVSAQLAQMLGGTSDAAAEAVFGPGVTFDAAVQQTLDSFGLPMDHMWNADQWAGALNALGVGGDIMAAIGLGGLPLDGDIVRATGDLTYDIVSQELGVAEIFGPSYSGQFWQENIFNTGDFTNWGVFADVDFAVTDRWHVIGGLRYSHDQKDFTWYIPPTSFASVRPGVSNALFPQVDLAASDSWSKVTGRLVTSFEIDDDQMLFVSYSTGYKSGGFDSLVPIDQSQGQQAFEPEDTTNFEVGYKAVLADQLVMNLTVYRTELDNFQISVESKPPGNSQAVPSIINENRSIDGLEIDLRWQATPNLILSAVSEIRSTDVETPAFYNAEGVLVDARNESFDASTNYTLSANWYPDVDFAQVNVFVDYVFVENIRDQDPDLESYKRAVDAYFADRKDLNARVAFSSEDDKYTLGIWAKNLLDERYVEGISGRTAAILGTPFGRVNRGREVGVDLKITF